jgi:hypothetical protein
MSSVVLAIGSGGAVTNLETTVLLTVEEAMEAMSKASGISYKAPGS